jgi:hypothetical protein
MSTERTRILKMLAEGKISVDEAEELLEVLSTPHTAAEAPVTAAAAGGSKPKYLRVQVDPGPRGGKEKVNIRVPLQLIRAGAKLTSIMPAEARDKVSRALREKGVEVDLDDLSPGGLDRIIDSLSELSIDVVDGEEKVRVFCE